MTHLKDQLHILLRKTLCFIKIRYGLSQGNIRRKDHPSRHKGTNMILFTQIDQSEVTSLSKRKGFSMKMVENSQDQDTMKLKRIGN